MTNPQKILKAPLKGDGRKRQIKQGSIPKAASKKKPAPLPLWGKLSALPRRVLIFGGVAAALIILLIVLGSPRKEAPPPAPSQAAPLTPGPGGENFLERPIGQPTPAPQKAPTQQEEERPAIKSIRFYPPQPTTRDTIKAEVLAGAYADPSRITYTYIWKVNNRTVEGATGNTLNLATYKKRDIITVTVTPNDGDKVGFPVDSTVNLIYGIPPSLDLQTPLGTRKAGEPLELQLVSLHPDSEGVTFSLEAPLVPGMSIDSRTGKITWVISPNQKGKIRFGAAVEDTDKTKVTKLFDITME